MSSAGEDAGTPHSPLAAGYEVRPAANGGWIVLELAGLNPGIRADIVGAFTNSVDLMAFLMTAHSRHDARRSTLGEKDTDTPEGGGGSAAAGDDALGVVRAFMRRP